MDRPGSTLWTQLLLLLVGLLTHTAREAHACGQTVLFEDFSRYKGQVQNWSNSRGSELFPKTNSRKSSNGKTLSSGFINGVGMHRLQIGNGELKIKHKNAGALLPTSSSDVCLLPQPRCPLRVS